MEERKRCYAYMLYVGAQVESPSIIHVGGKIEKPIAVNMYSTRSEMLDHVEYMWMGVRAFDKSASVLVYEKDYELNDCWIITNIDAMNYPDAPKRIIILNDGERYCVKTNLFNS